MLSSTSRWYLNNVRLSQKVYLSSHRFLHLQILIWKMESPMATTLVRPAGRVERRCIIRHALGFYGYISVGGFYVFRGTTRAVGRCTFISALKHCLTQHPILSTSIEGAETEAPAFVRPEFLKLNNHLHYLAPLYIDDHDDHRLLQDFTDKLRDMPCAYQDGVPAWKLVVLPILNQPEESPKKFWVGFLYSHSHADGKSSLAFHRTFLQGLQMADSNGVEEEHTEIMQPSGIPPLPPSLEDAANLTISWSFLLLPFLAVYLPKWLSSLLGLEVSLGGESRAWKATPSTYNPNDHHTGQEMICIAPGLLKDTLKACNLKGTKLSGILHQAIIYGLHKGLTNRDANLDTNLEFMATTTLDIRKLVPKFSENDMINCFSGSFENLRTHNFKESGIESGLPEEAWEAARKISAQLAEKSSTLADQPVGLLQYLHNFRQYMLNQLGKGREGSYELSNVGVFNPTHQNIAAADWTIEQMVFLQPANAIGSAINFNVITLHGGDLVMSATWQRGILGMEDEDKFLQQVLSAIKEFITQASKC